jgi:RNA polymerase sigma factor (sigma-70 family)
MRGDYGGTALRQIHTLFDVGTAAGLTDSELLERYATRGGEAAELAFAALVERHGPVVYRVCRRMLRDPNDAQDAFQAVFLVLIRRASAIRNRDAVGSWLYGVAVRVASESRAAAQRRVAHESRAARHEEIKPTPSADAEPLFEELARLPEKFRTAVVLCALEGYTCEEAARRLCWPIGTVRSRLTRGKARLRTQLARRGLDPSSGLAPALLAMPGESVPTALFESTLRAGAACAAGRAVAGVFSAPVVALSEGVLKAMVFTKMKLAVAVVLGAVAVVAGAGALAQSGPAIKASPRSAGGHRARYEIRVWVDGEPAGEPIVGEVADGQSVTFNTASDSIHIQRRGAGGPPYATGSMGPMGGAVPVDPAAEPGVPASGGGGGAGAMMGPGEMPSGPMPGAGGGGAPMMPGPGGMMAGGGGAGMSSMMGAGMMGPRMGGMAMAGAMSKDAAVKHSKVKGGPVGKSTQNAESESGAPRGMGMESMTSGMMSMRRMGGSASGPGDQEERLRELERKLDEILKRLDDRKATDRSTGQRP